MMIHYLLEIPASLLLQSLPEFQNITIVVVFDAASMSVIAKGSLTERISLCTSDLLLDHAIGQDPASRV